MKLFLKFKNMTDDNKKYKVEIGPNANALGKL